MEKYIGNLRKGDLCYTMIENLEEECTPIIWKAEFYSRKNCGRSSSLMEWIPLSYAGDPQNSWEILTSKNTALLNLGQREWNAKGLLFHQSKDNKVWKKYSAEKMCYISWKGPKVKTWAQRAEL